MVRGLMQSDNIYICYTLCFNKKKLFVIHLFTNIKKNSVYKNFLFKRKYEKETSKEEHILYILHAKYVVTAST